MSNNDTNTSRALMQRPREAYNTLQPDFPPGVLGEVAHYLYRYAPSPAWDYVIPTAIGFFAGICGRGWAISGTGLNHDIVVVGLSGTGKNVVHQGTANIAKQLTGTSIRAFINPNQMASAPALLKYVAANPCSVNLTGEVGKWYRAYSKSRPGDNIDQIFTVKLDLWERSGADSMSVGINYSDADKTLQGGIGRIAYSTLGESTPDLFYSSLSPEKMNEGVLSRLWIFEHTGPDPIYNTDRVEVLPEPLRQHLINLVNEATQRIIKPQQEVGRTPEAEEVFKSFLATCVDEKAGAHNDAVRQLWVRAYEKVLRLAALCAVADNFHVPLISEEHAAWAVNMATKTNINMLKAIHEKIDVNPDEKRAEIIFEQISRWLLGHRTNPKEQALVDNNIVSRAFLQRQVANLAPFRDFRGGSTQALSLTLVNLCDQGRLRQMDPKDLTQYAFHGKAYKVLG